MYHVFTQTLYIYHHLGIGMFCLLAWVNETMNAVLQYLQTLLLDLPYLQM
jgi:hypothetical protein